MSLLEVKKEVKGIAKGDIVRNWMEAVMRDKMRTRKLKHKDNHLLICHEI